MDLGFRWGSRSYRTAAAVFLALLVSYLLNRPSPFFAGIAAVICTQPTGEKTRKSGKFRLTGTVIGGVIGFCYLEALLTLGVGSMRLINIFLIPLAVLGAIYLCNLLGRKESVSICCVLLLNLATNYERGVTSTLVYVVDRVLDTALGVVMAMVVAYLWEHWEDWRRRGKTPPAKGEAGAESPQESFPHL